MQCYRQESVIIIFVSGELCEMDANAEKRQSGLGYSHKMMEVGLYFKQEIRLSISLWPNR